MLTLPHPVAVPARPGLASATPVDKEFENVRATAAWLYGITLVRTDGDDGSPLIVASIHALTRTFRSIAEVRGWLAALDALEAPRQEVARFISAMERAA